MQTEFIIKEIKQLAEKIMQESYPYCETEYLHLSVAASNINNTAHRIIKLIEQIKTEKSVNNENNN